MWFRNNMMPVEEVEEPVAVAMTGITTTEEELKEYQVLAKKIGFEAPAAVLAARLRNFLVENNMSV